MSKKVTFTLPAEIVAGATSGLLLGDFNNWDQSNGEALKKQKDGSLKATLSLEAGKTYNYRYLLNDGRWVNDSNAEHYAYDSRHNVHNCVITVAAEEKKAAPKKAAAPKEKTVKAAPAKKTATVKK